MLRLLRISAYRNGKATPFAVTPSLASWPDLWPRLLRSDRNTPPWRQALVEAGPDATAFNRRLHDRCFLDALSDLKRLVVSLPAMNEVANAEQSQREQ
jgi:hypothetical protein